MEFTIFWNVHYAYLESSCEKQEQVRDVILIRLIRPLPLISCENLGRTII